MADDMRRLLRPKTIAVVGGGAWGRSVIDQCHKAGFAGHLWHVHPRSKGAYPNLSALPAAPDAVFLGINAEASIEAVGILSQMGAGGVICFASGYAEAAAETGGAADRQSALVKAAGDMPILGPNCYGILNMVDRAVIWPDQHGCLPVDTGVALVTQSSNIAINLTMQARGLPIAYVVTAGNQAQQDLARIGIHLLDDPRVTALGLHIEGIKDLRAVEALAKRAHDLGKGIIALKVGASAQAQTATMSHTASLAGAQAGASALFKRLGIGQVHSLEGLLEALKVLHISGPLCTGHLASMSCSGGEAALVADSFDGTPLKFPPLCQDQAIALRTALGPKVALANPLDYHTYSWADAPAMAATFAAMMKGALDLGLLVLDFPRPDRCDGADWNAAIIAVEMAMAQSGKPIAILATLPDGLPEVRAQELTAKGIIALSGLPAAVDALVAAHQVTAPSQVPVTIYRLTGLAKMVDEATAKRALRVLGLDSPQHWVGSWGEVAAGKSDCTSWTAPNSDTALNLPLVVKGTGQAHKSDCDAVKLNLTTQAQITAAAQAIGGTILIEEQITEPGVELLVGVTLDPVHGVMLTLGAGGTLTELWDDTATILLPATPDEICTAARSLRIAPRLMGYRGSAPCDLKALVAAVQAIASYVEQNAPRVAEVEVNPLLLTPTRAIALDALIKEVPQ